MLVWDENHKVDRYDAVEALVRRDRNHPSGSLVCAFMNSQSVPHSPPGHCSGDMVAVQREALQPRHPWRCARVLTQRVRVLCLCSRLE